MKKLRTSDSVEAIKEEIEAGIKNVSCVRGLPCHRFDKKKLMTFIYGCLDKACTCCYEIPLGDENDIYIEQDHYYYNNSRNYLQEQSADKDKASDEVLLYLPAPSHLKELELPANHGENDDSEDDDSKEDNHHPVNLIAS